MGQVNPGVCFSLLFLVSAPSVSGQDAHPQEPALTIKTTVQEVVLDLVVRDSRGRAVMNLQPDDVEIYENGVRQKLHSFRLVAGRQAAPRPPAPVTKKPEAVLSRNPLKAVNLVAIVFHNLGLDLTRRKFALDAAQEFLRSELPPGTWVGIFSLDSHLTVLQPFTTDRTVLREAAAKAFSGSNFDIADIGQAVLASAPTYAFLQITVNSGQSSGGSVGITQKLVGGELNPRAITGADVSTGISANTQRGDLAAQRRAFTRLAGMHARDQLLWLIDALAPLPGRKQVLLFSAGLSTTGDPELFQPILDKANKAGITFYAIDTNGLTQNSNVQAGNEALRHATDVSSYQTLIGGAAFQQLEKARGTEYTTNATRQMDTQAPLRELSELTGGFLTGSTNDLRKSYQRLLDDLGTHYEAAYTPTAEKLDGRLRNIEVKLAHSGLTVQSRTAYYAMPALPGSSELQPFEMVALAPLSLPQPPHAFDVRTSVFAFRPGPESTQQALAFELPAAGLVATTLPESRRLRLHASLLALIRDSSGQVVSKFSRDLPYEIPEDELAAFSVRNLSVVHPLELPPGHYTVDTSVVDREVRRASVDTFPLEVPERKGLGLSSIALVERSETVIGSVDPADPFQFQEQPLQGRRIIPDLQRTLSPDVHPLAYFIVYPDKASAERQKLRVEILVNGQLLARQLADLPPPDSTGAIPMVVGSVARLGDCELRITALQGAESAQQSLKYHVQ